MHVDVMFCSSPRLSDVSGCKKFSPLEGPGKLHARSCILKLLVWCIRSQEFSRQRFHIAFEQNFEDCGLAEKEILAKKILERPCAYVDVPTDIELDGNDVPLDVYPLASWARNAAVNAEKSAAAERARGARGPRGGRGGRGRGRGAYDDSFPAVRGRGRGRRGRGRGIEPAPEVAAVPIEAAAKAKADVAPKANAKG